VLRELHGETTVAALIADHVSLEAVDRLLGRGDVRVLHEAEAPRQAAVGGHEALVRDRADLAEESTELVGGERLGEVADEDAVGRSGGFARLGSSCAAGATAGLTLSLLDVASKLHRKTTFLSLPITNVTVKLFDSTGGGSDGVELDEAKAS